jgi:hypothetical protein
MTIPTLILPVLVRFSFAAECQFGGRLDHSSPREVELAPTDPGNLFCKFDSGDFLQGSGDALPDRLGSLGRDFLDEVPKVLVLRGRDVEVLAALRG